MDPEKYIAEGLKIVESLMKTGNLQGALMNCQELLKVNPYDHGVQKLLLKIQKAIISANERKVDDDIDSTMHLWNEGRYDDLMKIYSKLFAFAPQHSRLQKMIAKLQEKIGGAKIHERKEFIEKSLEAIKGLLKDQKCEDAIKTGAELLSVDPLNPDAKELIKKAKELLIEKHINENQRVFEGADFERQLQFLDTLFAIDPENPKLKNLAFNAKAHLAEQKVLAEKIHLNESIARMKELFKTQEFEMVIQAAEEIERLDPKNVSAKVFKRKAQSIMRHESDRLILKVLKEAFGALKTEYEKNPAGFVKV